MTTKYRAKPNEKDIELNKDFYYVPVNKNNSSLHTYQLGEKERLRIIANKIIDLALKKSSNLPLKALPK